MGAGINQVLTQASQGLAANQVAQNVTSKNISNVNTQGYSRQRVELKSGEPEAYGNIRVGGGVVVGAVTRSTSDFLTRRLAAENTTMGSLEGSSDVYRQLEVLFKDDIDSGISGAVTQFFNDVRTLSTQPDSMALRTAVRESATAISTRFRNMDESINQVKEDVDHRIEASVSDVNKLTDRIAQLNGQIAQIEARGSSVMANDERDSRDQCIKELSKYTEVNVVPSERGSVSVMTGRFGVIVDGIDRVELKAERSDGGPNPNSMQVYAINPTAHSVKQVSDMFTTGNLGSYLKLRDQVIPDLRDKVDHLAYNLAESVNEVHRNSFGKDGSTGHDFFDVGPEKNAASRMSLSDAVASDVSKIAAAQVSNSTGDNRGLLQIADLQGQKIFDQGRSSFQEFSSGLVGKLGVEIKTADDNLETQRGLVSQLETFHDTISGVSLDEEAMNMIRFQKAFDANAKMIQVADSMLDTVMNLKRF